MSESMVQTNLGTNLEAAMRDAGLTEARRDARGLMPLADARRVVAATEAFEEGAPDAAGVLPTDTTWAALLSLEDAAEFVREAKRIRWNFHVRGLENTAPHERYGAGILPWIAGALSVEGVFRNVPWCLWPCLQAIGTPEALAVALSIRTVTADLDGEAEEAPEEEDAEGPFDEEDFDDEDEIDDADLAPPAGAVDESEPAGPDLGAGPDWLSRSLPERLPLVAARASSDVRAKTLLASTIGSIGIASIPLLRRHFGSDAKVGEGLYTLGIETPVPDPQIESRLEGLPRSGVPEGPPWSVASLDQDDLFPYWDVIDGYETPYAVRVTAFASAQGDALVVQRIVRDASAQEPATRLVKAYGPGVGKLDGARCYVALVAHDQVAGVDLPGVHVDALSETARLSGDADERGAQTEESRPDRFVRSPLPRAATRVAVLGLDAPLEVPPGFPPAWRRAALDLSSGDEARADALLRRIDPAEGLVLRLVRDHRERVFLGEAALRDLLSLPKPAELLFQVDDPELPRVYDDAPPSKTAPWPLLCEALRRRVRLDPARVERVDVWRRLLAWAEERGGPADLWSPETAPCEPPPPRGAGASPFEDALLARGWPHAARLLHDHPENDAPEEAFERLAEAKRLPHRVLWPREVAARFVRHAGGYAGARDKGGWVLEREAGRIVRDILARPAARLTAEAAERVMYLLEAFVGAPALLAATLEALRLIPGDARRTTRPDGFHAVLALGWVLRRATSSAAQRARDELQLLSSSFPRTGDLGRALDLVVNGAPACERSAWTPEERLFAGDAAAVAKALADGPLPLDVQVVPVLGEAAFARWEAQEIPEEQAPGFAEDLALLASPRAAKLAAKLRGRP